jgi:hypothetical protein
MNNADSIDYDVKASVGERGPELKVSDRSSRAGELMVMISMAYSGPSSKSLPAPFLSTR